MLSNAASNALLKTLEEPPDHVTFVLATTDPQKVLPTIRSRSQHYEFGLVPAAEMEDHVRWVITDAGLTVDGDAVPVVVRRGAGSVRDTLSALEQVVALGRVGGEGEPLDDLMAALAASDAGGALSALAAALARGREVRLVGEEVLSRLRDGFLVAVGAPVPHLTDGDLVRARAAAEAHGAAGLTRSLEAIGAALLEMRQAPDPRIPLEVALLRVARPALDGSIAGLVARIDALEQALQSGTLASATAPPGLPRPAAEPVPAAGTAPPDPPNPAAAANPAAPVGQPDNSRGPAAEARRLLAQKGGAGGPGPAAPAAPAAALRPAAAGSGPAPGSDPATTGAPSAAPPPEAPGAPPVEGPAPGGPPARGRLDLGAVQSAWDGGVLDTLSGGARAWFKAGRFTACDGEVAVLALPSEIHRDRCEEKRPEAERALAAKLGQPLTLRLAVGEHGGSDPPDPEMARASGGSAPGPAPSHHRMQPDQDDVDADDIGDVDELPVADVDGGVVARVMQAFPGSQVVE
jgi:DNA polymerase-3 subunit gamma/tau